MAFQILNKTDIQEFLELGATIPVVDVRTPSEFTRGHIPGAFNIPLFNDK
jgi:tRNA 2-selenouridine synthase